MINMTTGKPARLIAQFAMPLLLGNILQQMYNIVDSIVVGNFVGKEALAAVGNSFIVVFLLVSVFAGIGMGATILISQFFGANEKEKVKSTIDTIYIAMLAGGLLITIAGVLSARPFLTLMNTPAGTTMEMSVVYLQTLFLGTLTNFGYNINNAILQGFGDSKSPLLFLVIATILNIILDLIFVTVFNMGVFGVALATIIAQAVSFIFGVWYINRKLKIFHISLFNLKFNAEILRKSFQIGLPVGLQNMLFSLGTIVLQRLVNSYGSSYMAGYSAVNKIDMFVFMPIASFANAITTYVGQNVGAHNLERVKQGVKSTIILSVSFCVGISLLVLLFGHYFLMAFTQDKEVIYTGVEFIKRLMPPYFLLAVIFILNSAIRGAGQSIVPLISSMISLLVVRVPAAYLFDRWFGKYELFWCYGAGWLTGFILSTSYYLSGRWKKKAFQFLETNKPA